MRAAPSTPALFALLLAGWRLHAFAADLEMPSAPITTESDVWALEDRGEITDDVAEELIALLEDPVALQTANAEALQQLPGVNVAQAEQVVAWRAAHLEQAVSLEALVGDGVLTPEQAERIRAFVVVQVDEEHSLPERAATPSRWGGELRLQTASSTGDFADPNGYAGPPAMLGARLRLPWDLNAGLLLDTTRQVPGALRYDVERGALAVDPFAYRLRLDDAFVQWRPGWFRIVVGSFNIGFAERLTFDDTRRLEPEGINLIDHVRRPSASSRACREADGPEASACDAGERNLYVTPDFSVRQPLRGIAASAEGLGSGAVRVSIHAWLSYQSRSLYQYELVDRRVCADPRVDSDPQCGAPPIWVVHGASLSSDTRLIFTDVPEVFDELLGGAHLELRLFERFRFGVTAYVAKDFWHGSPVELDAQEWSKVPFNDPFGALGTNLRAQFGDWMIAAEVTRSVDSIPDPPPGLNPATPHGGGGFGVEQRTAFVHRMHEFELSLRFYDLSFVNPYARPPSAPDEIDGQRARNELGARLKYLGHLPAHLRVQARADFWVLPYDSTEGPAGTTNLYGLARVEWTGFAPARPSVWFDARNRNLASSKHGGCASEYVRSTTGDDTFDCSGDLYRVGARVDLTFIPRRLEAALLGTTTFSDDPSYPDRFRQDAMAWFELRGVVAEWLQLRARARYLDVDLSTHDRFEESLWCWLEVLWLPTAWLGLTLRYDVYAYLDRRASTLARTPNPEQRFFADLRWRF